MAEVSRAELREIAEQAAASAVRSTFLTLGIDVDDPIKAQEDFMVLREVGKLVRDSEFRKDMEHLRTWRLTMNQIKSKSLLTAVGILVTGGLGLLWVGFLSKFSVGGPG